MNLRFSRALVIAAVIATSAVPAFAQVTINGYYRGGSRTNIDTNGNALTAFNDRLRLNLSYVDPDGNFGFKTRLQGDSSGTTSGIKTVFSAPGIKYGYGFVKFLDGMLKVSAGYLDITDYAVTETVGNIYLGNVTTDAVTGPGTPLLSGQTGSFLGTAIQVTPMDGLSIAATVRTDGTDLEAHHFGLDAGYAIPDVGKVLLASQFGVYNATDSLASNDIANSFVSAGFSYTGIKGLAATASLRSTYKSSKQAFGAVGIVEYTAGAFFADVSTDIDFTNSSYYVEGEVSYLVIPQLKVRAFGGLADSQISALKANGSTTNQYVAGVDVVFPVGKAEAQIGFVYGDTSCVQIPVLLKVNF
jgi:hypothetical protein